jgi:hypothetical protein
VKKSIATISPTWFFRKVFQVGDGGRSTVGKTRDTVRSETSIPSSALAVNARSPPQTIHESHSLNQFANSLATGRGPDVPHLLDSSAQ